jgi:hypothetical protein
LCILVLHRLPALPAVLPCKEIKEGFIFPRGFFEVTVGNSKKNTTQAKSKIVSTLIDRVTSEANYYSYY